MKVVKCTTCGADKYVYDCAVYRYKKEYRGKTYYFCSESCKRTAEAKGIIPFYKGANPARDSAIFSKRGQAL